MRQMRDLSALKATAVFSFVRPSKLLIASPIVASEMRTDLSAEPNIVRDPSPLKATAVIPSLLVLFKYTQDRIEVIPFSEYLAANPASSSSRFCEADGWPAVE